MMIANATLMFATLSGDAPVSLPLAEVPIQRVVVDDEFWAPKLRTWREVTVPDCFTKFENDRGGAIVNFDRVRDGKTGGHAGPEWYDGLIYEMIRAAGDFLAAHPDPSLEKRVDGYIARIAAAAAKDPDGYLNTWTQLMAPDKRWGLNGGNDVSQHDVYNAGAMVEAAVHYYRATGKILLLQTATRLANTMCAVMGPPPKHNVIPGHALGEEALVNLFVLFREQPELKARMPFPVDERKYLELAEFWIENRGNHDGRQNYGSYDQDDKPVLQQETIEGHAVRATLLCTGLTAAGTVAGRDDYLAAARRLWNNMVQRRMYVTGGLGAVAGYEGFGPDYLLPNDGYLETCAAVGAGFFHHNMNLALGDARYADELERVLYNGVLAGVSLKGDAYFYENPLQAGPDHVRWAWHPCPCCPPMFLKIMGALPGYIYAQAPGSVYVNLFVGSRASVNVNGQTVALRQETRYPWDGKVEIAVEPERDAKFALRIRLPAWCEKPALKVNGRPVARMAKSRGYAVLDRTWSPGDVVELSLPMQVRLVVANPRVEADRGRVAIQRGPIVYCVEGVDSAGHVRDLALPRSARLAAEFRKDLLGGVVVVRGRAQAPLGSTGPDALHLTPTPASPWPDALYLPLGKAPKPPSAGQDALCLPLGKGSKPASIDFMAIPYFANANRTPCEMAVWLLETAR